MGYPDHLRTDIEAYLESLRFSDERSTDGYRGQLNAPKACSALRRDSP